MKEKLTDEQIQLRADELSKIHNAKVVPVVFRGDNDDDQVIGYLKEPSRLAKTRILDTAIQGVFTAAADALEICLLKEESDQRITSELSANDKYYHGAAIKAQSLIEMATDQFKKK